MKVSGPMADTSLVAIAAAFWKLPSTPDCPAILWRVLPGGERRLVGTWEVPFPTEVNPEARSLKPGFYLAEVRNPSTSPKATPTIQRGYIIGGPYSIWAVPDPLVGAMEAVIDGCMEESCV